MHRRATQPRQQFRGDFMEKKGMPSESENVGEKDVTHTVVRRHERAWHV